MHLRPYQSETADLIRSHFQKGRKRIVLCLPTGAGKTVVFSYLASLTLGRPGKRVLILTDRIELLTQAGGALSRIGVSFGTIQAGQEIDLTYRCHVGMVETFIRRVEKFPQLPERYDLVIIDECHKGNFKKAISLLQDRTYVIGATATPIAASKADPLKNYFDDIVCPVGIPDLIQDGYLVPSRTFSAEIDKADLKKQGGEYTEASQMEVFDRRERYSGVIEKWVEFAFGRKTICFCVNIQHSKKTAEAFRAAGISAMHVDGNTPTEDRNDIQGPDGWGRDHIFRAHKAGEFYILCNVGIATTGYDDPSVSCIIFDRVTTSIPLWLQCCGRGSRPFQGKENFIILDMGENHKALGMWQEERDWATIFHEPKKPGEGIAPTKMCPGCESIIRASEHTCPYCFYEIPKKERDEEELNVKFYEVQEANVRRSWTTPSVRSWKNLSISEIAGYVKNKTYKPGWAVRLLIAKEDPESALSEFAELMGYKPGWVHYQLSRFQTA